MLLKHKIHFLFWRLGIYIALNEWLPLAPPPCYDPANHDSVVTKTEFTDAGYNFFSRATAYGCMLVANPLC